MEVSAVTVVVGAMVVIDEPCIDAKVVTCAGTLAMRSCN